MPHIDVVIDGKKCPSVSQIAKIVDDPSGLINWAKKNTEQYCNILLAETGERGKVFHDILDYALRGQECPNVTDKAKAEVKPFIDAAVAWSNLVGYTQEFSEKYCECKELMFGGTLDSLGRIGSTPTICDWKLTSMVRHSHIIQPVGYILCLRDENLDVREWRIVRPYKLKFPSKYDEVKESPKVPNKKTYYFKDSEYVVEERHMILNDEYIDVFKSCLKIYNWRNK